MQVKSKFISSTNNKLKLQRRTEDIQENRTEQGLLCKLCIGLAPERKASRTSASQKTALWLQKWHVSAFEPFKKVADTECSTLLIWNQPRSVWNGDWQRTKISSTTLLVKDMCTCWPYRESRCTWPNRRVASFLARETLQLLIGWRMPTSRTKRTVVQPSLKKNPSLYS